MATEETCKAPSCDKEVQAKGYCQRHYAQWKRGELPKPRRASCNAEGCHKPRHRRGLCEEHFAKTYPGKTAKSAAGPEGAPASEAGA